MGDSAMNIAERIMEMKDNLQESKEEQIAIRSKVDTLLAQLKKEFGCGSIEEAEEKLTEFDSQLQTNQKQLEKAVTKFEEAYPFV
jgi:predicted nuclease with TOPRIM domain